MFDPESEWAYDTALANRRVRRTRVVEMPSEGWKSVPGYGDWYEAHPDGLLRSWRTRGKPDRRARKPTLLQGSQTPKYLNTVLTDTEGKQTTLAVHALIMLTFVGPCPEGMQVLHDNDDPLDNRLVNLRYGTSRENHQDRVRNGKTKKPYLDPKYVRSYLEAGHSVSDAAQYFRVSPSTIRMYQSSSEVN